VIILDQRLPLDTGAAELGNKNYILTPPVKRGFLFIRVFIIDEIYYKIFVKSTFAISNITAKADKTVIDNSTVGIFSNLSLLFSVLLKKVQNGFLNRYISIILSAVFVCIIYILMF
jgi:NADH:ubiquinone oxidoreductase subunit 5 (subunit L)/multisubunit Na+/H+ antiporter MnhA subunit